MATLLIARSSGGVGFTYVNQYPNATGSEWLDPLENGYLTQIKIRLDRALTLHEDELGTLLVSFYNAGSGEAVATGSMSVGSIPPDEGYAWYTVTMTGFPFVDVRQQCRLHLSVTGDYDYVRWRHGVSTFNRLWEAWDDGVSYYPGKPVNPTPEHTGTGIKLSWPTLTWESGGYTDTYNAYAGLESGNLNLVSSDLVALEIPMPIEGLLDYYTTHYWRIDATNVFGTTTGNEWYFKTIAFDPPLPPGITLDYSGDSGDEDYGDPIGTGSGEDNMLTLRKVVAAANSKIWVQVT